MTATITTITEVHESIKLPKQINLYFIASKPEDAGGYDLLVRATSAKKALKYWRKHWGLSKNPYYIALVPVIGAKGAIDWDELVSKYDFPKEGP